jgi:hypothetical protein
MGPASRSFRTPDLGRVEERTKYVRGGIPTYLLLWDLLHSGYNFNTLATRISNNRETHGRIFGLYILA